MHMTKRLFLLILVWLSSARVSVHAGPAHTVSFNKPSELHEYLRWRPDRAPLLGAHRGGPSPGFPENCIATFERSLRFAPCLIECDVRKSKDGVMVLMHDSSLDRTTTGKGLIESLTLAQLRQLDLVDAKGTETEYKIPTLLETLRWAKGRAILELDIKGTVTPREVVQAIETEDAESCVVVITYDLRTAELYHSLNDRLVLSCSAKGTEGVTRLLKSSIPAANLIAFVGVYEPPRDVYALLHDKAICAILGTMGNLDRKARRNGIQTYMELLRNGADVLATDEVELASDAITRYLQNRAESRCAEVTPGIPVKDYELVWSDQFNGTALDMTKWDYRGLGPRRDAVNVKDTVALDGQGHLVLTTKQSADVYHTAMIGTQGKYETCFGYFECRVRLQEQIGHWSAFWLQSPTLGQTIGDPGRSGTEIDIFEYLRKYPDTIHHNLHWDGYKEQHKSAGKKVLIPDLSKGWHTIGLLWTEQEYVFYVDGKESWRSSEAVSKRREYMILSLEVGKWAGDIADAALPDSLYVDYVRVYKRRVKGEE